MVFQSKKPGEDNEVLPGGGLELDLDRRMCASCGRETPPWEVECRECGGATVPPHEAPAAQFRLPHLEDEEVEDEDGDDGEGDGVGDDGPDTDRHGDAS